MPTVRITPSTACTWPCGMDRSTAKTSSCGTNATPRNARRKAATASGGHCERLARVVFTIFPPSRRDWRKSTAGGDFRLGTTSIYMVS